MKERWKSIVGYEGLYEVSDMGRVRSLKLGKVKVLKPGLGASGYLYVMLCKDGKVRGFSAHSLVVTTFKGPIPPGMQINHLNEIKTDNRLENLEVITQKENINYGTRSERAGKAMKGNTNGNKQLDLKLAEEPFTKLTFKNSYEASSFFKYKAKETVATYISYARKRGRDWINIRKTKYYFSQET